MSKAVEYVEHGWALCQFSAGSKGGGAREWNTREHAITDVTRLAAGKNIGLLHAWSGTCAIDCDDYASAREWLLARGVSVDELLAADDAVQIRSGRPNRAKLLFAIPEDVEALSLRSVQIQAPEANEAGKHPVWIEFRCATACGAKSVQDVLPPSIHPDTQEPYTWGGAGDWRELPELPAALLALWRNLVDETPRQRKDRGATGPGTSSEVLDFARRLHDAGLKPYRCGSGFRSYCPHHGGQSGTSLKLDEDAKGRPLWHCKAGCSNEQVSTALNAVSPRDRGVASVSRFDQLERANDARKAANDSAPGIILPEFPDDLLALPHGLGAMQDWIHGYMAYPSRAAAGFTALATLAHFAMAQVRIESRRGLGLNEQYLLLAPTGFGKEDLRAPFEILGEAILQRRPNNAGNLWPHHLPKIQYSAPASQQGLHQQLESHRAQTYLSDEFADWLCHSASDSHKMQALSHIMQAYSKAFSTLAAPAAVTKDYKPVDRPRVLIFATSTAERLLEAITASQADSGALNRFLMLVSEQDRLPKRYKVRSSDFVPPVPLVDLVAWVSALDEADITFSVEAEDYYEQHDQAVLDPLKFSDNRLAGRLNEQAFKIAALIALSDRRLVIEVRDLCTAYAIREGIYHRAATLIGHDGALSGMHTTGRALEQVRNVLSKRPYVYRSNLTKLSRQFERLSLNERDAVLRALQAEGFAQLEGGKLVSLICEKAA